MRSKSNEPKASRRTERFTPNVVCWSSLGLTTSVWLLWWLGLYPGFLSADSLDMWHQAQDMQFYSWHPYLYAWVMGLLKHVAYTPAMMGLLQVALMSLVVATIARFAAARGVRWYWILPVVLVYALNPQFGVYNVFIWTDIPFSIAFLAMMFALYRAALPREGSWWPFVAIGLLAGLSVSIRVNGVLNLVLPALLLLALRVSWKKLGLLLLTTLVTYLVFSVVLFNALHVQRAVFQFDQVRVKTIGAIYNLPDPNLTPEERRVFESMWPASVWQTDYSPESANQLFFVRFEKLNQIQGLTYKTLGGSQFYREWTSAFLSATLRNPSAVVYDKAAQGLWMLFGATDVPWVYLGDSAPNAQQLLSENYPNVTTVLPWPHFQWLRQLLGTALVDTANPVAARVLWAPTVPVLACIAVFVLALLTRRRATATTTGFILLNVVFVILAAPASDYRYLYFAYLCTPAVLLLLLAERARKGRSAG